MSKQFKINETGDTPELQSLFDSISVQAGGRPPRAKVVRPLAAIESDSAELEALFESVAKQAKPAKRPVVKTEKTVKAEKTEKAVKAVKRAAPSVPSAAIATTASRATPATQHMATATHPRPTRLAELTVLQEQGVYERIGHMTRTLHDTLRELGFDHSLEKAANTIPDTRRRLDYIAEMTEKAASRVLNATDLAKPIQDALEAKALALNTRWSRLYGGELSLDEFKALAGDTKTFIGDVPNKTAATNAQLMEIMMAQDFQDLTGQVIKKIVDLAQSLEAQLLQVLIQSIPDDRKSEVTEDLLNGPLIDVNRPNRLADQEQVDDLLESLGF